VGGDARGPQVFSGYWNQDDETAEVFTEDGWLRTGDLVQVRDGFIYMADRRKEMINSSGFNVYPSQVEAAIRSMRGVADVAVVGLPDGAMGELVCAAVVLAEGTVPGSVPLEAARERGFTAQWLTVHPDAGQLTKIAHYLQEGTLRVHLDRVFPLDSAAEAHRRMESSDHIGKILLAVNPGIA